MTSKAVLVIGCGYLGTLLARYWKLQGHFVTVTTTTPGRLKELKRIADRVLLVHGTDSQQMAEALEGQEWVALTVAARSKDDYPTCYLGTAKTLKDQLLHFPSCTQLVYTSSTSVYGECEGRAVTEEEPLRPLTPQSLLLQRTENQLLAPPLPTRICVLRLGELIGPGRELIQRLTASQGTPLRGSGEQYANLSPAEDVVAAVDFACLHQLTGIYNLCADLSLTRRALYNKISAEAGLPPPEWGAPHQSLHGGNKRVLSNKIRAAGFVFRGTLS